MSTASVSLPASVPISNVARAKGERLLIVDEGSYWYAWLPFSQLLKLPIEGRYIYTDKKPYIIGGFLGALVVMILSFGVFSLTGALQFASFVSVCFGGPLGFLPGWVYLGRAFHPGPLWVFRRVAGELIPVVPNALGEQYDESGKMLAVRAKTLYYVTKQAHSRSLFKIRNDHYRKMQMGAMVGLVVSLAILLFLIGMAQQQPKGVTPDDTTRSTTPATP